MLVLSLAITFSAASSAKDEIISTRMQQMNSIRISKTQHIQDYFSQMKYILTSKALSSKTVQLLWDLDEAYEGFEEIELDLDDVKSELLKYYKDVYLPKVNYDVKDVDQKRELAKYLPKTDKGLLAQYNYIVQNPNPIDNKELFNMNRKFSTEYSSIHVQQHPIFRDILKDFGRDDIYLVNLNGDVIYSVFKNPDYATNLLNGPYSNTGLARAFVKSQKAEKGEAVFEDISSYEPSLNKKVAFLAMPIYFGEDNEGTIIFQLPLDKINKIMNFNNQYDKVGLGSSGESYLIGKDLNMRSDSRFISNIDTPDVKMLETTIGTYKIDSAASSDAISGKTDTTSSLDYLDQEVITSYSPLDVYGENWAIVVKIDKDEALK